MGARSGGGSAGNSRGGGGFGSGARQAAPKAEAKPQNSVEKFLSQAEHNTGDVFSHKPETKMQDKLHNMMYSGGTKSVNEGVTLDASSLIPTQSKVWSKHLSQYTKPRKYDDNPIVATYKGKNYVIDGHHRIVGAKLQGQTKIKVTQYVMKD